MKRPALPESRSARSFLVLPFALAGIAALWWRGPNWREIAHTFTHVSWWWVAGAIALNLLSVLARALCWRVILTRTVPEQRIGYRLVLSAYSVGLMANAVLPGRVGEVARVAVLRRKIGSRPGLWPTLLGSVVAHRLLDLPPVAALVVWILFAATIPSWASASLVGVLAVGGALFLAALAVARGHDEQRRIATLGSVRRASLFLRVGLGVLRAPRCAAIAGSLQLLGWFCQLFAVWASMRAFQIDLPLAAAGLVLALMNVANILPLWPGNIGLLQAAVALPLLSYGVGYAHGFAFGIGLQAIEASVGVGYGLAFFLREGLSFALFRPAAADSSDADEAIAHDQQRMVAHEVVR